MHFKLHSVLFFSTIMSFSACKTTDPYTQEGKVSGTTKGSAVGAATGAVLGNQVKGDKATRTKARVAGAVLGGLFGGGIGKYMDRQEEELRGKLQETGVSVTRKGDEIILNMPGNITFDSGNAKVKDNFHPVLDSVADVLKEYKKTTIEVSGHTDSVGQPQNNQLLSEQRASTVAAYLRSQGIPAERLSAIGYGESSPIDSNDSASGKARNRRVEIKLLPVAH